MNWILTRNDNQASIELPEDMRWTDEHVWNAIAQSAPQRSLTGSQFIFQGTKKGGRPITVTTGDDVWIRLGDINTLRAWTDVPKLEMKLTHYDGREFEVMWRLDDNPAIDATPVEYRTPEADTDPYFGTFKLRTTT